MLSGGTSGTDTIGDASGAGVVQTGTVNFTSVSDIGSLSSPVAINANSLNATSSTGSIYVSQQSAGTSTGPLPLTLTQVSANAGGSGGTADITNTIGNILVDSVATGTGGSVTLDASAGPYTITDTAGAAAINSGSLTLLAGSAIGSSSDPILTNVSKSIIATSNTGN